MKSRRLVVFAGFALCLTLIAQFTATIPVQAGGGVFVVNTTDDLDDGACDATHCSLREAINMVNTYAGVQYIHFDIPGSGPHEIQLCSLLPSLSDDGTVIDGTTEPDYAAGTPSVVIKPGAFNVSFYPGCMPPPVGIWVAASDITVRGLSIIGFMSPSASVAGGIVTHMGSNVIIERNYIGLDPSGTPDGNRDGILMGSEASVIDSNCISGNVNGIHVFRNDHVIRSNFIGTDPTGTSTSPALKNAVGVLVDNPSGNVQIGGPDPTFMNLISGNDTGIQILTENNTVQNNRVGSDSSGVLGLGNDTGIWVTGNSNLIEANQVSDSQIGVLLLGHTNQVSANFIGTDASGDLPLGNDTGIHINGDENVIGGGIPIMVPPGTTAGNIISGNDLAIYLTPQAQENHIYGNKIGAGNSGDSSLPNNTGILLDGANHNTIGSTHLPHEANWIMHNVGDGIQFKFGAGGNLVTGNYIAWNDRGIIVGDTVGTVENTFHHNSIYYNTGLGIDLSPPWGVTPNDPGDADNGGNNLLNFPVITSATTSTVQGTACLGCTVEVFETDEDPSSDYGEGISPVGEGLTDVSGNFSIAIDPIATVDTCDYVSATATDASGNTSEFALNFLVGPCFTFTPPLFFFLGVVFLVGGAVVGSRLGRSRGTRPVLATAGGAAAGGAIGVALIFVASFVPYFQLPPDEQKVDFDDLTALIPSCDSYLDPQAFEPQDGEILLDENFNFEWGWLNAPSNGDFRWTVELSGADQTGQETTEGFSLPFTTFGFAFEDGDHFLWRLTAEQFNDDSTEWEAFCAPTTWRPFQIGLSPLLAPPWTPEIPEAPPTPTKTPEPEPAACIYTARKNSNCRVSVYKESDYVDELHVGETAELIALNPEFTYGKFELDHGQCWIWLVLLDGPENPYGTCDVPVVNPPPSPTATPTPLVCTPELDREDCEASGGTWPGVVTRATGCICPD